jgi:hypothetical protein
VQFPAIIKVFCGRGINGLLLVKFFSLLFSCLGNTKRCQAGPGAGAVFEATLIVFYAKIQPMPEHRNFKLFEGVSPSF